MHEDFARALELFARFRALAPRGGEPRDADTGVGRELHTQGGGHTK
jgi:hypothetical protein